MMAAKGFRSTAPGAVLLLLFSVPSLARAQYQEPPPPAAYALKGVTVHHADGRVETGVNVVVRRGLVEAMGRDVTLPADAEVLEGDSLHVYPGLVDAQGTAKVEFPDEEGGSDVLPWDPPRTAQGFTPRRRVADYLTATGGDGESMRKKGIVAAAVLPDGGMAPGQGSLLLFRKTARYSRELVVRPSVGLYLSLEGARGAYPGTLFGVMAYLRQAFEDAHRLGVAESEYARDPRGLTMPRWDPDYEVLRAAAAGRLPVFFAADRAGDIRRVLDLAKEIGFRPVIVGGGEAWKVADELKARNIPVLVSLDFPEPKEWKPEKKEEPGEEEKAEEVEKAEEEQEAEQELTPAAAREKEKLENLYANPARLAAAGVTFALTSGGGKADLRKGVRKVMEYGLSEEDALRALTLTPAELLGVPALARLEPGLAATFVVTDGPLFDEDTAVRYTLVEGEVEKGKEGGKAGAAGEEPPTVDVTGKWELVVTAEGMSIPFSMTLTQEGATVTGRLSNPDMGNAEVRNGVISGNRFTFTLVLTAGPESMEARAEATVEGDVITGSGSGEMGSFTFRATRKPGERKGGEG